MDDIKDAKWIQVGTVMDHPLDGRSGRLPNRFRKRTLTQQWMVDPEMGPALKKRFTQIEVRAFDSRHRMFFVCRTRTRGWNVFEINNSLL